MKVCISQGNSKMGSIRSVSLPPIKTCPKCSCSTICYANKVARIRPTVRESYERNLETLRMEPDRYWKEVDQAIATSAYFRFHVSGDIPDADYFARMVVAAYRHPACQILCFTKRYEIVNKALSAGFVIPQNLHVIFSAWRGYPMYNPYGLPEAHVLYSDGFTTAKETAKSCGGNCTTCAETDSGCWTLRRGEQVVFRQH